MNNITIEEVENGWIIRCGETAMVYHTWPEVVQWIVEYGKDDSNDGEADSTDPIRAVTHDHYYGRGF